MQQRVRWLAKQTRKSQVKKKRRELQMMLLIRNTWINERRNNMYEVFFYCQAIVKKYYQELQSVGSIIIEENQE